MVDDKMFINVCDGCSSTFDRTYRKFDSPTGVRPIRVPANFYQFTYLM